MLWRRNIKQIWRTRRRRRLQVGLVLQVEMATEGWIWFCRGCAWFCRRLHGVGLVLLWVFSSFPSFFFFSFFLLRSSSLFLFFVSQISKSSVWDSSSTCIKISTLAFKSIKIEYSISFVEIEFNKFEMLVC